MLRISALVRALRGLPNDEHAATATEYAVMLALVLAVIIASVAIFGQGLNTEFGTINCELFA